MNLVGLDRKTIQESLYKDIDKQRLVDALESLLGAKDRTILAEWLRRDMGDITSVWTISVSTRQVLGDEDSVPISVTTSVAKPRKRKPPTTAVATAAVFTTKTKGDDDYVPPGGPDEKRPKNSPFQSPAEDGDNADTTATKQ